MDDLISRQAAIDGKISIQRADGVEIYFDEAVPVEYLKALPPAQPAPFGTINHAGLEHPLSDEEIIPRLRQIQEQVGGSYAIDRAIELLTAQPEIIRCKDCKFWTHIKRTNRYWCKTDDGLYDLNPSPNDFCSRAERRTDEHSD